MRRDLAEIVLVVDRSGSMAEIRQDAESGINGFIREQQQEAGNALLTLVQFDTVYEFICRSTPIDSVQPYSLIPRGATALLDAVGRAVIETGERLKALSAAERPGLVVVVIVTDGHENSSREFTRKQIREMIEHQQDKYNWQFTFLAANQDAFAEGGTMGISPGGIAQFAQAETAAAYQFAAGNVCRMRRQSAAGETIRNEYTLEERRQME